MDDVLTTRLFLAAWQAVEVPFAYQYLLVDLLKLKDYRVHLVDGTLERFEVLSYSNNILVKHSDLELMVIEIILHLVHIRLSVYQSVYLTSIKFLSDILKIF